MGSSPSKNIINLAKKSGRIEKFSKKEQENYSQSICSWVIICIIASEIESGIPPTVELLKCKTIKECKKVLRALPKVHKNIIINSMREDYENLCSSGN